MATLTSTKCLLPAEVFQEANAWRGLKATVGNTCDNQAWTPGRKNPSACKSATSSSGRVKAIEVEGQSAVVAPGMKGKVLSLHDGFHLDVTLVAPIPPKAIVQFENGMNLMVDERMKWEKMLSKENQREIGE